MIQIGQSTQAIPEQVLSKLSPSEKRVALATYNSDENPKLCDQNKAQWDSLLVNIILKSQVKLGLKPSTPVDQKVIMLCINEDLTKKFPNLTRTEVYLALDAGLDGNFLKGEDDKVFFNPSNLIQWIKLWLDKVKKPAMAKVYELKSGLPTPVKEKSEKDLIIGKYLKYVDVVASYMESQTPFVDVGQYVYGFLLQFNLIEPVSREDVEAVAITELQLAKFERDKSRTKELDQLLENFMHLENVEDTMAHPIATRNAVMKKIREVASWEQADIEDYFEAIKVDMAEYFRENNL